ncbi:glycine-rich protein family [Trichomonas vaginalis G3]|uniref:glycine-rich protein family n=1 Tax=Trichomonas vaginalis (strain ATCC PRA-98 / G3) TaxID=412133 RepID=UPI0021E609EB|nr:glycine-rich protein family [Trichomonas vaginalis G3]KAI5517897.1 glycine-rich protein family [Trichomonas vaginalis G3]
MASRGTAGYAGGLVAGNGVNQYATSIGASQTNGNKNGIGADGRNGKLANYKGEGSGGSGGGYRGGLSSTSEFDSPGSGGSSYISGHPGCVKFVGIVFNNAKIVSGNESMILPNGTISTGNPNHGYLRITYLLPICSCLKSYFDFHFFLILTNILLDS